MRVSGDVGKGVLLAGGHRTLDEGLEHRGLPAPLSMVDFTRSSTRAPAASSALATFEHRLLGLGGEALGDDAVRAGTDLAGEVHDRCAPGDGGVVVAERGVGAGDVKEGDGHAYHPAPPLLTRTVRDRRPRLGGALRSDVVLDPALADRVAAKLTTRGDTVAVAEGSCGGLISASLLAVPGASKYFVGGSVIYTRTAKEALLPGIETAQDMRGATEEDAATWLALSGTRPHGHDVGHR